MGLIKSIKRFFSNLVNENHYQKETESLEVNLSNSKKKKLVKGALEDVERSLSNDITNIRLRAKKMNLITQKGKAYELLEDGEVVDYYPTILKLAEDNNLNASSVYKAFKDERLYKKTYKVNLCQEY